jgi:hypothetical protein
LPRQDDIASVAYWYQTLPTAAVPTLPERDYLEVIESPIVLKGWYLLGHVKSTHYHWVLFIFLCVGVYACNRPGSHKAVSLRMQFINILNTLYHWPYLERI